MTVNVDIYRRAFSMPDALHRLHMDVGRDGFISCPNHDDGEPSCKVYHDHVHCFGCGFHADTIGMVMHAQRLDFWGTLEWIAREAGLPPPQRDPETQKTYEARQSISATCEQVYADSRKDSQPAIDYLAGRGVSEDLIREIVGFLPSDYEPADRVSAERAGLISRNGNFLFAGRCIIPIRYHGAIVNFYGRALDSERIPRHVYCGKTDPPMPGTLWGLDSRRNGSHYYLTESIIDALTLETQGFPGLGAFGTQGLTDERVEVLKRSKVEKLTLVFDTETNESGHKGALKAGERLFRAGLDVRILELPLPEGVDKVDANSYFVDHTAEDFRELEAKDFFACLCETISREGSVREKAAASKPIIKLVADLDDELLDRGLLRQIQKRCPDFQMDALVKRVRRHRAKEIDEMPTGGDFLPDPYADAVLKNHRVIYHREDFYFWSEGVYRPHSNLRVKRLFQELGHGRLKKIHLDDALHSLMVKTEVEADLVNRPGIINLRNGYIDLMAAEPVLSVHTPELLTTLQLPIEFDENAECPAFLRFLKEKVPDLSLRNLLQEMVGYLLIPSARYQRGFVLWGKTGTGKSTLFHIMTALIGRKNRSTVPLDKLGDRFNTASIDGKLANFTSEVSSKVFVQDGIVKAIISGDDIIGEEKHKPPYSFQPYCRLVVACNEPPLSHDTSNAFFRRWTLIPFNVQMDPRQWDQDLPHKIVGSELPGILLWALAGLARLRTHNAFSQSEASLEALDSWKRGIDPVREFCHRFLFPNEGDVVKLHSLFTAFNKWCKQTNRKSQFTDSNLKQRLEGAGYEFKRRNTGFVLKDHWLADPEEAEECTKV